MTVDLSTLKIGDKVLRRDNEIREVSKVTFINSTFGKDTAFYCSIDFKEWGKAGYSIHYTKDGAIQEDRYSNLWDIVKIIPKEYLEKESNTSTIPGITGKSDYNPATAKTDTGKDRLDLLPYAGLSSAAKAFEYGMSQYGHNNYQNAKSYRPFLAAATRHLLKKLDGEDLDNDSGLDHICHALACLLMAEKLKELGKPINDPDTMKSYGKRNKPND